MKSKLTKLSAGAVLLTVTGTVCAQEKSATPALTANGATNSSAAPAAAAADPGLVNSWLRGQSASFNAWDLGGQLRARFEHAEYLDAPGAPGMDTKHGPVDFRSSGGDPRNDHLLLRELVHIGYTPVPWANFYVEGRDSTSTGDDRDPNPDSDNLALHQAYVRLGDPKQFPLIAKVGRQELIYGDERLIGASDWTNVKRTFDALKVRYETDQFWVDAFTSRPVVVWDDHFNESNDYDIFSGLYASSTTLVPVQESQLYFLARNTDAQSPQCYGPTPDPQGASPRDIYTVGTRVKSLPGKLGSWDYATEVAYQFGRFKETTKGAPAAVANKNLDQQAYAASVGGGYTWKQAFGTPHVGVEYVYSSGDSNPTDNTHGTFDNLFPTNHKFYGIMDLFSWQNVQIIHPSISLKPAKGLTVSADYRVFWLADTADSFYTNKGARRGGLLPTNGSGFGINPDASNFLGSEIDLVANYSFKSYASLQAGVGHFFTGSYIDSSLAAVGGASDATFVYGQFTFKF
jgi:hypothetical protein